MLSRLLSGCAKKSISVTTFWACVSLSVLSVSVQAVEVYSWVDENGIRHFAGQPPGHDDYELMTLRGNSGTRVVTRPESRSEESVVSTQETTITTPDRTVTVIDPEVVAANCNRARNNIDLVNSRRRIVLAGEDGEPRRLDDNERLALISESQAYIDENCG